MHTVEKRGSETKLGFPGKHGIVVAHTPVVLVLLFMLYVGLEFFTSPIVAFQVVWKTAVIVNSESNMELVWAKSAHGVWDLANILDEKWHFT